MVAKSYCVFYALSKDKLLPKFRDFPALTYFIRDRIQSKELLLSRIEEKFRKENTVIQSLDLARKECSRDIMASGNTNGLLRPSKELKGSQKLTKN